MKDSLLEFCKLIDYQFKNFDLLEEALTHPSLNKNSNVKNNYERLEFLGDKVLSLVISEFLMKNFLQESEGSLSKRHSSLVSGETLAEIALKINLNEALQISFGEKKLGGNSNKKNLENALEALIGAIYLDSSYEEVKKFILELWNELLLKDKEPPKDPVSELQELIQSRSKKLPIYETIKSGGLDHAPKFISNISIPGSNLKFSAIGNSKKEAQKNVAKITLDFFYNNLDTTKK
jgi:ribonuclease-3